MADATAKAKFPDWPTTVQATDGYVFAAPVGGFQANLFGLYDRHGKLWCTKLTALPDRGLAANALVFARLGHIHLGQLRRFAKLRRS